MKSIVSCLAIVVLVLCTMVAARSAANPDHIDPCALIGEEKVITAFPVVKTREKQTIGPNTTCNYLNEKGFPALIVSAGRADHGTALSALAGMGDGYSYQAVSGLGDSAAMAMTKAAPELGVEAGIVAELHVIKHSSYVNLAPIGLDIQVNGPGFAVLKQLAAEMATRLP